MNRSTALTEIIAFCVTAASEVVERVGPRFNQVGYGAPGDSDSEKANSRGWGPLGWFARPLPPEVGDDGEELEAENVALRTAQGLEPFAWSDERLVRAANPGGTVTVPAEGQFAQAHYGGGVDSWALVDSGDDQATVRTLYVPYQWNDGSAEAAMLISLDPENGVITLCNGLADGSASCFLNIKPDEVQLVMSATAWASITPDLFCLHWPQFILKGNVVLGANPIGALPLLAGVASPPSPSVFVSPV